MKTLTEKYNGVLKGTFSKDQFLRDTRLEQPQLVTQHNSYQDAVNILLNRGIISEIKEDKPIVKENYSSLEQAKAEAERISAEEGVVQHVNELPGGGFVVSDWYDDDFTVASFQSGVPLNEKKVAPAEKKSKIVKEEHEIPKPEVPLDALDHGIRFELDKKGLDVACTVAEYLKAKKAAIKNLEKDLMHYHKLEGASEMPVSKTDQMVKVKLKESIKYLIKKVLTEGERPKKTFTYNGKLK